MDRIDRLTIKALDKTEASVKPWTRAMMKNPYAGRASCELLELLSVSQDDWREIVQACVWIGGS